MEVAKLVLGYIKALIWPVVILVALGAFSGEIRNFLKKTESISAGPGGITVTSGTGKAQTDSTPQKSPPPDVWFSSLESSFQGVACQQRAIAALDAAGFQNRTSGDVSYGYHDQAVGAVWCSAPNKSVLITVAGPYEFSRSTIGVLENYFVNSSLPAPSSGASR